MPTPINSNQLKVVQRTTPVIRKNGLNPKRITSSVGHYRWKIVGRKGRLSYRYPIPVGYWSNKDKIDFKDKYHRFLRAERFALFRAKQFAKTFDTLKLGRRPFKSTSPYMIYSVKDIFVGQKSLEPEWKWVENISIVYTWVNGSEPGYLAQKSQYLNISKVSSRDRNNDELKYSLRALQSAMPWHKGIIYLVSPENHVPSWMTQHPRLKILSQDNLVPKEFQPTFNTNCIESWLHKIPGLTDKFIYMNDDFYLYGAYIHPSAFFTRDGYPRLYQTHFTMFSGCSDDSKIVQESEQRWVNISCQWTYKPYTTIREAGLYAGTLFDNLYGPRFRYYPRHAPYVFEKEALVEVVETFPKAYHQTCKHKTRSGKDVSTTFMHHQFLVENYEQFLLPAGKNVTSVVLKRYGYGLPGLRESMREAPLVMLKDGRDLNTNVLRRILFNIQPLFFTLNDDYSNPEISWQMKNFLGNLFPRKSFAEK
eukprot:TRINITY_DN6649_c0_g2_i1.p1 TRINITY_DN6649_c0_g2~~TRINITY_DN6649_c0_g2_i1.p1  ORF type:complete len:478 (-),score=78.84 TRINITY_DN6649_c0_g2_i1:70-1503(-)